MRVLKKWGLLIAFAVGGLLPGLHVYSWIIPYVVGIMLTITLTGMEMQQLRPRREHILVLLANLCLGVIPWGILHFLGYKDLSEAAFLTCIVGAAAASPVVVHLLGGKSEFAAAGLLLNSVLASVAIPALAPFTLSPQIGEELSRRQVFLMVLDEVMLMLILPCVLSMLLRILVPASKEWSRKLNAPSLLLWMGSLMIVAASCVTRVMDSGAGLREILPHFLLAAVLCTIGFALGRFIGGKEYSMEAGQILGQKNAITGIHIALCYCAPLTFLCPTLYLLCQHLFNTYQFLRAASRRKEGSTH